jgi:hypothetical protein
VMVVNRPKVSFWPDDSTGPGNYGWLFIHMQCRKDWLVWMQAVSKPWI